MIKDEFLLAYDKYGASILRHIYFRVNSREAAEDLTQDTFFKAWDSIIKSEIKINNYKTFLFKVANNLIIDYYRKKPRFPLSIENVNPEELSDSAPQTKEADVLLNLNIAKECLMKLNDEQRQIVIFRYIDDLSVSEISEITGRSKNSVSVILHRSLNFLKKSINEKYV